MSNFCRDGVNSRPTSTPLTNLQKFTNLKDLLTGDAAACIKSVPTADEYYVRAVTYILQRYGNPERVVTGIFAKLIEMPKIFERYELHRLKENLDKFNNGITTLETMSISETQYASMIYPLLLRTIPDQLIKSFVTSLPDREDVKTDVIEGFHSIGPKIIGPKAQWPENPLARKPIGPKLTGPNAHWPENP